MLLTSGEPTTLETPRARAKRADPSMSKITVKQAGKVDEGPEVVKSPLRV